MKPANYTLKYIKLKPTHSTHLTRSNFSFDYLLANLRLSITQISSLSCDYITVATYNRNFEAKVGHVYNPSKLKENFCLMSLYPSITDVSLYPHAQARKKTII